MERRILFFTCVAHALTHVYMAVYPAVLVLMSRDFEAPVPVIANYATISVVLFGLGALPASWLGERLGEKWLLVAFFALSGLGGTAVGLAHGWTQLAVGMALLGLGTSIFHPVGNTFIAKGIRMPGRAMGVNGLWGSFGEAFGPIFAAGVALIPHLSWRWAYLLLTIPTLAVGGWLAATPIDLPRATARPGFPRLSSVLLLLLAAMTCGGFQFWIVKTMLPLHIDASTSPDLLPDTLRGGALAAAVYLIGGFGQLLSGRLVHHREGRGLYAIIFLVSIPFIYAVGKLNGAPLLVTASLMSLLMFAAQPIENVLLAKFAPPGWASLLFGFKFTLAFGVGGLGASLSARVRDAYSLGAVFTTAAGFTTLALAFALSAWSIGGKRERQSRKPAREGAASAATEP
jgi:FSR family fosmidomycin resistance protein-like MFS transporter